jgi:hypothetical protein
MRALLIAFVSQIALVAGAGQALAQDQPTTTSTGAPGVVIEISDNTSIGGQSVARNDEPTTGCPNQ